MSNRDSYPNFIILGAAKAGTTALYHYLKQHPDIYMSPLKETNYFALAGEALDFCGPGDADYVNCMSITTPEAYRAQFDGVQGEKAVGEASPLYLYNPRAAQRIKDAVPDTKLLAILRNPVDRAYSAFLHLVRDNRETTRDFATALSLENERIEANFEHIWHYISMGRYYEQVKRYYDRFDGEQIKVSLYVDLRTEPQRVLRETFEFLGLDSNFAPDTQTRYNEASLPLDQRPPLLTEVRQRLQNELRDDILKLQDLIGRDLSHWLITECAEKFANV
jgi:hypothetical protein